MHPMDTCNGIAIHRRLRSSVGHEVEQIAEEDGWQESKHITHCATNLPICTQEEHPEDRVDGDTTQMSSIGPYSRPQTRSRDGLSSEWQQESREQQSQPGASHLDFLASFCHASWNCEAWCLARMSMFSALQVCAVKGGGRQHAALADLYHRSDICSSRWFPSFRSGATHPKVSLETKPESFSELTVFREWKCTQECTQESEGAEGMCVDLSQWRVDEMRPRNLLHHQQPQDRRCKCVVHGSRSAVVPNHVRLQSQERANQRGNIVHRQHRRRRCAHSLVPVRHHQRYGLQHKTAWRWQMGEGCVVGAGSYQGGQLSKLGEEHDVVDWPSCALHQQQSTAPGQHGHPKQHLHLAVSTETQHRGKRRTYLDRWMKACRVESAWAGRGGRPKYWFSFTLPAAQR